MGTFSSTIVETDLKTLFSELHHLLLNYSLLPSCTGNIVRGNNSKVVETLSKVSKVFETHFNGFQNLKNFSQSFPKSRRLFAHCFQSPACRTIQVPDKPSRVNCCCCCV